MLKPKKIKKPKEGKNRVQPAAKKKFQNPYLRKLLAYTGLSSIVSMLVLSAVWLFGGNVTFPVDTYLVLHNMVELSSIIISVSIFLISWYSYKMTRNRRDLILGVAFFAVGILDIMHMLSFPGMPDFVSGNSTAKAINYWIVARLVQASAFAAAGFVPAKPSKRRFTHLAFLAGVIAFVAAVFYIVTYMPHLIPLMFIQGQGLTPLKIGLEYLVVSITAVAIIKILHSLKKSDSDELWLLLPGLIFFISSELAFTLYTSAFGTFNVLGHIFKTASMAFVFSALFVSGISRPFVERRQAESALESSEKKYRDLVDNAPIGVYQTNLKGDILYANDSLARMFEFGSSEEMKSRSILTIYKDPKDRKILIENLRKTGKVTNFEVELLTKTGKPKNTFLSTSLAGDIITGMIIDITERKKADEELKKRAEELERFTRLSVGRELKMIDLKKRIRELADLLRKHGIEPEGR